MSSTEETKELKRVASGPKTSKLIPIVLGLEVVIILLFILCTSYAPGAKGGPQSDADVQQVDNLYSWFQDVHVMIFIGFGFLMTFLKKGSYSAVGLTFLLGAFCIQWHILVAHFWEYSFHDHWQSIELSISSLIKGDFAAGAVLITYGVLLGKVSPLQLLFTAIVEVIFFSLNEEIGLEMEIADLGGSMVIHMFGAFFGLAMAFALRHQFKKTEAGEKHNGPVYHSDMFAMIGTVFLWMYWPSFNGVFGTGNTQHRAAVNTVLSLCGSCASAFLMSMFLRKDRKFDMVDIQNATLAGGVAMGTCADMLVGPGPALLVGFLAGVLSVIGYVYVQPALERAIGLRDTCGVNNLHGMPSILGAVAGVVAAATASQSDYGEQLNTIFVARPARDAQDQALMQLGFIAVTLGISIVSGYLTGCVVSCNFFEPPTKTFEDEAYWEVPEDYSGKKHDDHEAVELDQLNIV